MKLVFGSDHAGFELRSYLAEWSRGQGHDVTEVGAANENSYDYPVAADLVAKQVLAQERELGVLVCGTGIGVCIRANRYNGIRAADCTNDEMAVLARQHNAANVLCLGGRILSKGQAVTILRAFLETPVDTAERHARRVALLDAEIDH